MKSPSRISLSRRMGTLQNAFYDFFFVEARYYRATDGDYKLNPEIPEDRELIKKYRNTLRRINMAKSRLKSHPRMINQAKLVAFDMYRDAKSVSLITDESGRSYYA